MPLVSVIIVNYNGGCYPARNLESLSQQTFRDFEVIFVDNSSSDGSADDLPIEAIPDFQMIRLEENSGFARGNNLGASAARGRWLALLNPDARAEPDWLESLVAAADAHPDVRHFASAQLVDGVEGVLDGGGDNYLLFGIPWRGGYRRSVADLPEQGWCFSPCGAGAFIRKDAFDALHGFDERFFCYCEDVDLGFRMQRQGFDCRFLPQARIHHVGGVSSNALGEFSAFYGSRNRLWTYFKNMPTWLLVVTFPVHILLTLAILAKGLVTGNARPVWKGIRAAISGYGALRQDTPWSPPPLGVSSWGLARRMAWNPLRMLGRQTHVRPD